MASAKVRREYDLRLKNRTLVTFSVTDGFFDPIIAIDWADNDAINLMPLGMELTGEGIWLWMQRRSLPRTRRFSDEICRTLGFSVCGTEAIYQASMGLSLDDAYWVPPAGSTIAFEDVTPYMNHFSDALANVALYGTSDLPIDSCMTPELTTDGTLRKAWAIDGNGKRCLRKGRTFGYNPGEPASEAIASTLADLTKMNHVRYRYEEISGEPFCTCSNFTDPEHSYVPYAAAADGHRRLADVLAIAWLFGNVQLEQLRNMLVFDCLICNSDRHFANFGFLRDNGTGELMGLVPVFDNGRGLFPRASKASIEWMNRESLVSTPAFGGLSFEKLCSTVMGPVQAGMLETIAKGIDDVSLPKSISRRAESLAPFLKRRAQNLANRPMPTRRNSPKPWRSTPTSSPAARSKNGSRGTHRCPPADLFAELLGNFEHNLQPQGCLRHLVDSIRGRGCRVRHTRASRYILQAGR